MRDKQKLLLVVTKSNWGGAQKYVYEVACEMQEHYDVSVALGGTGELGTHAGELAKRLGEKGVHVLFVRAFAKEYHLFADIRAFFEIFGIVRTLRPQIVHGNSSKAAGISMLVSRILSVPVRVVTLHGLPHREQRPWYWRWAALLFSWCTAVCATTAICINTQDYTCVRRWVGIRGKAQLIHVGIRAPHVLPRAEARRQLTALGAAMSESSIIVGTIGELTENKNHKLLIDAMVHVQADVELILIGSGALERELLEYSKAKHVEQKVMLVHAEADAAQYLSAMDIFVLPSHKEGLPYVLLEAGHAALPAVASDIPGNREVVKDGETGLLCEQNAAQFAATIDRLATDPTLRTKLGTALHTLVASAFSQEEMCSLLHAAYEVSPSISRSASSRRTERA